MVGKAWIKRGRAGRWSHLLFQDAFRAGEHVAERHLDCSGQGSGPDGEGVSGTGTRAVGNGRPGLLGSRTQVQRPQMWV